MQSSFREDIQGLRALAVLSVVIYHLSPKSLVGGFIGVDIFFVISGYLIIGQICAKLETSTFSLSEFYVKRFKRLFPAYFVVAASTSVFAFFYFLPGEFENYSLSLLFSSLYVSNFYFYSKSGYFDAELQGSPLLHTWSLSVEEQFYAIFPIVLLVSFSFFYRYRQLVLLLLGAISLVICILLSNSDISFAFFSSVTRFWQFIVGGLAALATPKLKVAKPIGDLVTAVSGLMLVGCVLFMTHENFPGVKSIIPTVLTAIVLLSCPTNGLIYRICSFKWIGFFGNTSYSVYLWHWPVIIFYPLIVSSSASKTNYLLMFTISVALGTLSYYLVENRVRKSALSKVSVWGATIVLTSLLIVFVHVSTIFHSDSFSDKQKKYESFLTYQASHYRQEQCFLTSGAKGFEDYDKQICVVPKADKNNIVLIGDSHAAHWYAALAGVTDEDETLSQITASGCKPLLNTIGEQRCVELLNWAFSEELYARNFSTVVISARWLPEDVDSLVDTVTELRSRGLDILVMGPIIEYEQALPRLLATVESSDELAKRRRYDYVKALDEKIKTALSGMSVEYISVVDGMCESDSECITTLNGSPIQFDYGHLTQEGADHVLRFLNFKNEIESR